MNFGKETLLVIAPHADDEILGCFKLIEKVKKEGGKVIYDCRCERVKRRRQLN